jgi:hypothetical protein
MPTASEMAKTRSNAIVIEVSLLGMSSTLGVSFDP